MTTAEFLRKYPERQKQWLEENMEKSQRLAKEIKGHEDIVVVDNLDVYRNLPQKLLEFFQWYARLKKDKQRNETIFFSWQDNCLIQL